MEPFSERHNVIGKSSVKKDRLPQAVGEIGNLFKRSCRMNVEATLTFWLLFQLEEMDPARVISSTVSSAVSESFSCQ